MPTPFIVAYEIYVEDVATFEKTIHKELSDFRVNPNREFFRYPLNKAIELMQNVKSGFNKKGEDAFEAIEIMPQVIKRYGNYIDSSISSIRICQDGERVFFEFTKDKYIADYLKDQIITRTDLGFIIEDVDEIEKTFNPEDYIDINVSKFLTLDDISIAFCVGEIFTDDLAPKKE